MIDFDKKVLIISLVGDVLLSFITFINAKAYEFNSNFKIKSAWKLHHFMNSDLNEQAQALEVTFSRKTKSYHSQTCFNNNIKNSSEWETDFLSSYYREKCSNAYKIRKSVLLD